MCKCCSFIKLVNSFSTPDDYESTINYIQSLIKEQDFMLIEGNCEIGCHKNEQGYWVNDFIYHIIQCPKCGQVYSCSVNTYKGGGSFEKGC